MRYKIRILMLALFITLLGLACSSWFSDPTPDSDEVLQSAWEYFEMGNYDMALMKFESVVSIDPDNAEAYNGIAWCYLIMNDIENAKIYFITAINKGMTNLDPHAGLAAVYVSHDEFSLAISEAEYVLGIDSNYVFRYNAEINYLDMNLILAMSYYHIGDFTSTYNFILVLDPDVVLDENNASTWILDGHQYESFAEILLAIIDNIDAKFGSLNF